MRLMVVAGLAPAMPDCTLSFIRQQSPEGCRYLEIRLPGPLSSPLPGSLISKHLLPVGSAPCSPMHACRGLTARFDKNSEEDKVSHEFRTIQ